MLDDKDRFDREEPEQADAGAVDHTKPDTAPVDEVVVAVASEEIVQPVGDPVLELPEIPEATVLDMSAPEFHHEEAPRKRSFGGAWKTCAAAVALVAIGAGIGSATTLALSNLWNPYPIGVIPGQSSRPTTVATAPAEGVTSVIPGIYKQVSPAVVAINVSAQRGRARGQGTGSGFVVDPSGYILTNYHVIDGAQRIQVKFVDGTILDAKVVGSDRYQDLAVIKVDPGNRGLVAARLGDSNDVEVGELAVAIGTPFQQEFTVTAGIISALNRSVQEEGSPWTITGVIQTDAAINPGNSGGPLLNDRGEVIGINTLIETGDTGVRGNIGIGFAIPINTAKSILPRLMDGESVKYAYLGVSMGTWTPEHGQQFGIDATEGAYISEVRPGTPAEAAGLQSATFSPRGELLSADVVVAIDDRPIRSSNDLAEYVASKKVGDQISMTVVRGKERLTLTATLIEWPADQ